MPTVTGVADSNGDFNIPLGTNYVSGENITVKASKDGAEKTIHLSAPSDPLGGGVIAFSGTLDNFPNNIGTVTISGEIVNIPSYAFAGSGSTGTQNAFAKSTGLIVGYGNKSIANHAFYWWKNILFVNFPVTLQSIGDSAFAQCSAINQKVTLVDSITSIGSTVMSGCTSVPEIYVGEGITIIPANAFSNLTALTKAEFKGQITSMVANSCNNWSNCNEIILHAITPPTITATTFNSLKATCIFKVPAASVAAYQAAANWSAYAARIQAI
jgi:hypothetical protein